MKYVDPYTLHHSERLAAAWASINQVGTQAVLDSYNVSSITDLGVGRTRVNFDNALADGNFSATADPINTNTGANTDSDVASPAAFAAGSVTVLCRRRHAGNVVDDGHLSVMVFGDPT